MRDLPRLGRTMLAFAVSLGALGACQSDDGGGPIGKADVGPVIGAGFSAALRADLSKATGIPAPTPAVAANAPATAAGDKPGTEVAAATPTAAGAAGDKPSANDVKEGDKPGTEVVAAAAATPTAGDKPAGAAGAAATAATPTAGDTPVAVAATPTPVTPTTQAAATPTPTPAGTAGSAAGLPAELAAVTLTLNEGWVRDSVGPGTFSFFAPGEGGKNIRFVFKYAYEDATAPTQREPYKQWLASTKAMNVTVDRQRGAAWFLEGTDAQGAASFRYVITYGGRLLTCGGSLYKSGPAAGLRDLRDEIIMQAKRICESMDLQRT